MAGHHRRPGYSCRFCACSLPLVKSCIFDPSDYYILHTCTAVVVYPLGGGREFSTVTDRRKQFHEAQNRCAGQKIGHRTTWAAAYNVAVTLPLRAITPIAAVGTIYAIRLRARLKNNVRPYSYLHVSFLKDTCRKGVECTLERTSVAGSLRKPFGKACRCAQMRW